MRDVIILGGAAGMDVVYHYLRQSHPDIKVAVLDERATTDTKVACKEKLPIIRDWDFAPARKFFGLDDDAFTTFMPLFTYPRVKKVLVDKALAHGLAPAPTFICPDVTIIGDIEVGMGGFIGKGSDIASDAKIGNYVSSGNAVIGHDVSVGDYCTVGTNTALLGYVSLGEGVQVSPGAVVRTGVKVAPWVIIGIQAAVVADINKKGITVGGVPAKELTPRNEQ